MDHRPPQPDQPYRWDDERLSAYLDGELSAPEQAQLEARLVVDTELRQLVDELRAVRQQLEVLPEFRLQSTFAEQVLRRAEQEMVLAPIVRDTTAVSTIAVTTAMPVVGSTVKDSAIGPLSSQRFSRRWRRGVFWTAVAAAAALLLMVINRPLDPEQDQIAQHDPMPKLIIDDRLAKQPEIATGSAQEQPQAEKSAAHNESSDHKESNQRQRKAHQTLDSVADPALATKVPGANLQKSIADQGATPPSPSNESQDQLPAKNGYVRSAPAKPAVAIQPPAAPQLSEPASQQLASPGQLAANGQAQFSRASDKYNADELGEKGSLKKQASTASSEAEGKSNEQSQRLTADVLSLLASEEFSKFMIPRDDQQRSTPIDAAHESIMVVHVTARAREKSDDAFESLLASNAIKTAEQTLEKPLSSSRAQSIAEAERLSSGKTETVESKDRKAVAEPSEKITAQKRSDEKSAPQLNAESSEYYYLEADEAQVQALLQQLRATPERFAGLSVASRQLPQGGELEFDSTREVSGQESSLAKAAAKRRESPEGKEQARPVELGKQKQLSDAQLAQTPEPVIGFGASKPTVPVPAAAPLSASAPASANQPAATETANAASTAVAASVPASPVASEIGSPTVQSFSADAAKPMTESASDLSRDATAHGNRLALRSEQQSSSSAERPIAYRLLGLEKLNAASQDAALNQAQDVAAGAGGGGAGGFAGAKSSRLLADSQLSEGAIDTNSDKRAAGKDGSHLKDDQHPMQAAKPAAAEPAAVKTLPNSDTLAEPKTKTQEESLRTLNSNKESELQQRPRPAEMAKALEAGSSKRIRVLFVIEHEPTK